MFEIESDRKFIHKIAAVVENCTNVDTF